MIHFNISGQKTIHTNGPCPSLNDTIILNNVSFRVTDILHKITLNEYNRQSLLLRASDSGKKFSSDPTESFNESIEFLEEVTKGTFNGFNKDKTAFVFSLHEVDVMLEVS